MELLHLKNFGVILNESRTIGNTMGSVSVKYKVLPTKHSVERKTRYNNDGSAITDDEILALIHDLADNITQALVNDETYLNNKRSNLLLQDSFSKLNVVISVDGDLTSDGYLTIKVVTVMRIDIDQFFNKNNTSIIRIVKSGDAIHIYQ